MISLAGFANIARALRNPNYGTYAAGNGISLIGTWMQRVAVGWLTWQLTESGAWLGVIAFADLFPTVLVGLLAGAAADRWNRLNALKIGQGLLLLQALLLFLLTATGAITIWLLLALSLFLGVVAAFNQPARLALVPSLVTREDLPAAVAINSIIFNGARLLGPAAAGAIIVTLGIAAAFAINAASYVVFLILLSRIRLHPPEQQPTARQTGLFAEVAEGLAYSAKHGGIGPLLLLLLAVGIGARPVVELLPGFAGAIFQAGAEGLALMTSTVGLGAVLAGLWLAQRGPGRSLTSVALLGPIVGSLAIAAFALSPHLWVALLALLVAGSAMVASGVGTQTLLQLSVDGALRGRVLSLYGMIFRGAPAIGALAMGSLSEIFGLRWPLAGGALLAALACALIWLRRARLAAALEPARGEAS